MKRRKHLPKEVTTYTPTEPPSHYLDPVGIQTRRFKRRKKHHVSIPLPNDTTLQLGPMKLLQFHDNYRPPYYGTYSKKSSTVTARRPLSKDVNVDYTFDSDEEWEEDDPGEDLSAMSGEDDDDEGEDLEEDGDGFEVPDGYLSADEGGTGNPNELIKKKGLLNRKNKVWAEITPFIIGPIDSLREGDLYEDKLRAYEVRKVERTTEPIRVLNHLPAQDEEKGVQSSTLLVETVGCEVDGENINKRKRQSKGGDGGAEKKKRAMTNGGKGKEANSSLGESSSGVAEEIGLSPGEENIESMEMGKEGEVNVPSSTLSKTKSTDRPALKKDALMSFFKKR